MKKPIIPDESGGDKPPKVSIASKGKKGKPVIEKKKLKPVIEKKKKGPPVGGLRKMFKRV